MVDLEGGHFAEAVAQFRQAVDLMPPTAMPLDTWARAGAGSRERGAGRYQQAVHWEPELISAYLGLARCHSQLGEPEAAMLAVERVLQLDPSNAAAMALRREIEARP